MGCGLVRKVCRGLTVAGFGLLLWLGLPAEVARAASATNLVWSQVFDGAIDGRYLSSAYSGGLSSSKPALEDIDGDGDLDMFVGTGPGNIVYYENAGTRQHAVWLPPIQNFRNIQVSGGNAAPTFADTDRDGDLDLFTGEVDGNITYYKNTGTRNNPAWAGAKNVQFYTSVPFIGKVYADIYVLGGYSAPTFFDADGDGDLDLMIGAADGKIYYYRNSGSTTVPDYYLYGWYAGLDFGSGSLPVPHFADIDGDNDLDMFVGKTDGYMAFVRNTGSRTSPSWGAVDHQYKDIELTATSAPFLRDIDGDGDQDLFTGEYIGIVTLYPNAGTPASAQFPVGIKDYNTLDSGGDSAFFPCDLDGDLDFDALLGESFGLVGLVRNAGSPNNLLWSFGLTNFTAITNLIYNDISVGARSVPTAADLDADRDLDLLVGGTNGTLTYFQNLGSRVEPLWSSAMSNYAGISVAAFSSPALGDLDGDEDLDLLLGQGNGTLQLIENTGTASAVAWAPGVTSWQGIDVGNDSAPALADLDEDGDIDLFVGGSNGRTRYYENRSTPGNPLWTLVTSIYAGIDVGDRSRPAFFDMDGDGDLDLWVGELEGGLNVWRNQRAMLSIAPAVATLAGGVAQTFTAAGASGAVAWQLAENRSGAALDPQTGVYVAGGRLRGFIAHTGIVGRPVPDGSGALTVRVQVAESPAIEQLAVAVDLRHARPADVTVEVVSPAGTSVRLRAPGGDGTNVIQVYDEEAGYGADGPGSLTNFIGEAVEGEWQLRVEDAEPGVAGILRQWSLIVNGGTPAVDVIEARDATGLVGRAYVNVIGNLDVSQAGKAIIVAGGKSLDDPVWAATDHMAGQAYRVLRQLGYARDNVHYHNFLPARDVDGNGADDDIDGGTGFEEVRATFTNAVAPTDRLFVYLVDHGSASAGAGQFRLNGGEILTATDLDAWLDALQDAYQTEVTVVLDFCYAGSFLDELTYAGPARRIVLAATRETELTYFIAGGLVSFSDVFFGALLQGLNLAESFQLARDAMSAYQHAQLDDTGDGLYNPDADGRYASSVRPGASFVAGRDVPQISLISPSQTLEAQAKVTLWASEISSVYPLARVWATVIPPNHRPNTNAGLPVVDVPLVDLSLNPVTGRYEAEFSGFSQAGTYATIYYAQDIWGGISFPKQSFVTQSGTIERFILVAGAGNSATGSLAIAALSAEAFQTARTRLFGGSSIYLLDAAGPRDLDRDGTNDVDATASLATLSHAITNWAASADRLTIYLIGDPAGDGSLRVNATESVSAAALDAWLDRFQSRSNALQVVLECDGAGSFCPVLAAPAGRERIVVASSRGGQPSLRGAGGLTSFSHYFLTRVQAGRTVGEAFRQAARDIQLASGLRRQQALLDDDGDGLPGEPEDGLLAVNRYIGAPFVTGDDSPFIGAVMPETPIFGATQVVLWAASIVDADGISNVWCYVTPPDYRGESELPRVDLVYSPEHNRYEGIFAELAAPGPYVVTFHAQDNAETLSPPVQTLLNGGDAFEVDDSPLQATAVEVSLTNQVHNFHAPGDQDWIAFYALNTQSYELRAEQLGSNVLLGFDLYAEEFDGSLTELIVDVTSFEAQRGTGLVAELTLELGALARPSGMCYLRAKPMDVNSWGEASEYALSVFVPVGGGGMAVVAVDKLNPTRSPPGAVAVLTGPQNRQLPFNGELQVTFTGLAPGTYAVTVPVVPGYRPEAHPSLPNETANPYSIVYGNPKLTSVTDTSLRGVIFQFVPEGRSVGRVRDRWTGAWVADAEVTFRARVGVLTNLVFDGYPPGTTYREPWRTRADGTFPTNVLLPTTDWNLRVRHGSYVSRDVAPAILGLTAGGTTNLGTIWLDPADGDADGVGDGWEWAHFAVIGTNAAAGADSDGDGHDNHTEYRLGTDPTNAASVLALDIGGASGDGLVVLTWPVAPGRVYRVVGKARLNGEMAPASWDVVDGPWTGQTGQGWMMWTNGGVTGGTNAYYRVGVAVE